MGGLKPCSFLNRCVRFESFHATIPNNRTVYCVDYLRIGFRRLYRLNKDVYAGPNVWKVYTVSYLYYNTIGTVVGVVVGLAVSTLSAATPRPVDPKLLAPFVRKFVSSEPAVDIKMAEYRPVPPDTERHTEPWQTTRPHMPDGI